MATNGLGSMFGRLGLQVVQTFGPMIGGVIAIKAVSNPEALKTVQKIVTPFASKKTKQLTDLTTQAKEGTLKTRTFEREEEMNSLITAIGTGGVIILHGKSGVGKTALVEDLAIRIAHNEVTTLSDIAIYQLKARDTQGTNGLMGTFQKILNGGPEVFVGELLDEMRPSALSKKAKKNVLFIDEIQDLLNICPQILEAFQSRKEELASGLVIIGGTTNEKIVASLQMGEGMARRVTDIEIRETTPQQTIRILEQKFEILQKEYQEKYGVLLVLSAKKKTQIFERILALSEHMFPNRVLPERAVTSLIQMSADAINNSRGVKEQKLVKDISQKEQVIEIDEDFVYQFASKKTKIQRATLELYTLTVKDDTQFKETFSDTYFPLIDCNFPKLQSQFIQEQAGRLEDFFKSPASRYLAISGPSHQVLNLIVEQFNIKQPSFTVIRCHLEELLKHADKVEIQKLVEATLIDLAIKNKEKGQLIVHIEAGSLDLAPYFKKEETSIALSSSISNLDTLSVTQNSLLHNLGTTFNQVTKGLGLVASPLTQSSSIGKETNKELYTGKSRLIQHLLKIINTCPVKIRCIITHSNQRPIANGTDIQSWEIPSIEVIEIEELLKDLCAKKLETTAQKKRYQSIVQDLKGIGFHRSDIIESPEITRNVDGQKQQIQRSNSIPGFVITDDMQAKSVTKSSTLPSLPVQNNSAGDTDSSKKGRSLSLSREGFASTNSAKKDQINTTWIRKMVFIISHALEQVSCRDKGSLEDQCLKIFNNIQLSEKGLSDAEIENVIGEGFSGAVSRRGIADAIEKFCKPDATIFKEIIVPEYFQDSLPPGLQAEVDRDQKFLGIAESSELRKQYLKKQFTFSYKSENYEVLDLDTGFFFQAGFSNDWIAQLFKYEFKERKSQKYIILTDEETLKIPEIKKTLEEAKCKVVYFCKVNAAPPAASLADTPTEASAPLSLPFVGDIGSVMKDGGMSMINQLSAQLKPAVAPSTQSSQDLPALKAPEPQPVIYTLPLPDEEECKKILTFQLKFTLDGLYERFHSCATLTEKAQQALIKLYLVQKNSLDFLNSSMSVFLSSLLNSKAQSSDQEKKEITVGTLITKFHETYGKSMNKSLQDLQYIVDPKLTTSWYRFKRKVKNFATGTWYVLTLPVIWTKNLLSTLLSSNTLRVLSGLSMVWGIISRFRR